MSSIKKKATLKSIKKTICPAKDGSKSPLGVSISLGTGCFISKSIAQKIYITSSCLAEVIVSVT